MLNPAHSIGPMPGASPGVTPVEVKPMALPSKVSASCTEMPTMTPARIAPQRIAGISGRRSRLGSSAATAGCWVWGSSGAVAIRSSHQQFSFHIHALTTTRRLTPTQHPCPSVAQVPDQLTSPSHLPSRSFQGAALLHLLPHALEKQAAYLYVARRSHLQAATHHHAGRLQFLYAIDDQFAADGRRPLLILLQLFGDSLHVGG